MLKKILVIFILTTLLLPFFSLAQVEGPQECCTLVGDFTQINSACAKGTTVGKPHGFCKKGFIPLDDWSKCCAINTVANITNWLFYVFLGIVVVLAIWTGFLFLTAGGDPEKIKTARMNVLYIVIGIIVAVVSRFLPAFIAGIVA